jgi:hypothetical protein
VRFEVEPRPGRFVVLRVRTEYGPQEYQAPADAVRALGRGLIEAADASERALFLPPGITPNGMS